MKFCNQILFKALFYGNLSDISPTLSEENGRLLIYSLKKQLYSEDATTTAQIIYVLMMFPCNTG